MGNLNQFQGGDTALHVAALHGNLGTAEVLIRNGALVSAANKVRRFSLN